MIGAAAAALVDSRAPFDDELFEALNGLSSPALDAVFVFASSPAFAIGAGALLLAWLVVEMQERVLYGLVPLVLAIAATDAFGSQVLKPWFGRLRPCFALPTGHVRLLVEIANSGSLPSLHAGNAFAAATVMALLIPKAGFACFPLAALVAVSRVGVGVHWPSDVLAGAAYGVAVGFGAVAVSQRVFGLFGRSAKRDPKEARPRTDGFR